MSNFHRRAPPGAGCSVVPTEPPPACLCSLRSCLWPPLKGRAISSSRQATLASLRTALHELCVSLCVCVSAQARCACAGAVWSIRIDPLAGIRADAAYNGPLYNVTRSSDGKSKDVGVVKAGGVADIATHDAFCAKLDCVISNVYDQSPKHNHLGARHKVVNASEHKVTIGGSPVYGMWFDPGYGASNLDATTLRSTLTLAPPVQGTMSTRPRALLRGTRRSRFTRS